LFILRYRARATGPWLLFEKKFGFFLGGHETLLRFKLRNAVPPDVEFAWANGPVTTIVPKTRAGLGRERRSLRALSSFRLLWFDTPELKAMSADGLFDRIAGKIVRRSVPGRDRSNLSPGTKLIWQIATGHVSDESSQTGFCI
jgi:hypothetical protein